MPTTRRPLRDRPAPIDQQAVAVDAQRAALDLIGAAGRQAGGGVEIDPGVSLAARPRHSYCTHILKKNICPCQGDAAPRSQIVMDAYNQLQPAGAASEVTCAPSAE